MAEMTSRERFARMFEHREADRIPILDSPWGATWKNWKHIASTPQPIDFVCKDPDTWYRETKPRIVELAKELGRY